MASSDESALLSSDAERDHDGNEDGTSDPLLGELVSSRTNEASNKRLLLYAGPALLLCAFVVGFDVSFISANYNRRIAAVFHELNNASWIVLGFTVTESACQPLYGHASQIYGNRKTTLIAAAAMAAGLVLCSLSHRLWQLAVSRAAVGTGSAGLQFLVVVIMNDLVQLYDLPLWKSTVVITETCALMLGGPLGSMLIDNFGFRPAFGIQSCLMFIAIIALYFTLRLPKSKKRKSQHIAKRVDFLGAILLLASVATPLFAINLGGEMLAWNHPAEVLLLCLTPCFIALFYYVETRIATSPIIPMRFIRMPPVMAVFACGLPILFAFDQLIYSFGTYLEARSFNTKSTFSDWALTCVYLGRPFGTIFGGILIRRYRKFKPFLQINVVVNVLIYLAFALGWIHPEKPAFAPFLVLVGFNEGFSESCWLVALLSLVDTDDQPLLYAFYDLGLAVAGDLGIAISLATTGALVRSNLHSRLSDYPNADEIIRKSLESLDYIRELPPNIRQYVLDALTLSTEKAFGISCAVLIIGLIATFFLREMPR